MVSGGVGIQTLFSVFPKAILLMTLLAVMAHRICPFPIILLTPSCILITHLRSVSSSLSTPSSLSRNCMPLKEQVGHSDLCLAHSRNKGPGCSSLSSWVMDGQVTLNQLSVPCSGEKDGNILRYSSDLGFLNRTLYQDCLQEVVKIQIPRFCHWKF